MVYQIVLELVGEGGLVSELIELSNAPSQDPERSVRHVGYFS